MTQHDLPTIIQGGMGVAVSSWQLARTVALSGQLGVVSGTALDAVLARRLQDGDPTGDIHRALDHFPVPALAEVVRTKYFRPGGRTPGQPYLPVAKLTLRPTRAQQQLAVVANFVEVWLAKEGHHGLVGVNYLEKVQLATPAAAFGAILAGVDYVLMGAGVPREIPRLLADLAAMRVGRIGVDVHGSEAPHPLQLDPVDVLGGVALKELPCPRFLAIVSSHVLAGYLARDESIRPYGFVVEGAPAGGHNAPPRNAALRDELGQPVYGPRDEADLAKIAALDIPFWLAGGYGTPAQVAAAREVGAAGVQVGTLFALSAESGITADVRSDLLARIGAGTLQVRTDALASPTGFPFKVAQLPGTLSEDELYEQRPRLCDLGYLREPYLREDGDVGYRCAGEPVHMYVRKGGDVADTAGRKCLCNALTADVGMGQTRRTGYQEMPLVTLGADTEGLTELLATHPDGWTATDAVTWLLRDLTREPALVPA
ncbi:MAG TPA: nitronate monooxygenase [Candidatus Nanopelagicales bacterium]|jgi:NAD(P)H-dependent flavin oxidoreductase YrpB (nitropropane dioxygenase family)